MLKLVCIGRRVQVEKFVPDIYQKDIFSINYDRLYSRGIRCLLFDLDNTLVLVTDKKPNKKIKDLFDSLKKKGFKLIIFSNSPSKRLQPFKDKLVVDICPFACKPLPKKFLSIIKVYNLAFSEIAIIGDSMMDDIYGGNNVGITTILVERLGKKEFFIASIKRKIEKLVLKRLRKNKLFIKGNYYEV